MLCISLCSRQDQVIHVAYDLGLYSLSGKTSYRKISWSLEAARFGFELFQSLWNLAGTSAALLPRCLSNFRAIRLLQHPISRLRDFMRFGGKTSYRLVNRGPGANLTPMHPLYCWGTAIGLDHIDGLVQERRNAITNALKLRLFFCTNPSI